ncbi:Ig-like domain-containing protein [Vacuolonema iberomarrocanum]|uniref:Ig-like domain-containing protein n=1 Tax=Vacuolonema iberomarrocanum TaxID=3454632 RepID=UPI0019E04935|nr:FG-GAP repeat protein [filamentous cyanobacterium LEGE 07170]
MTFPAQFNLSTLNGSNGFVINGIDERDSSGRSVSGVGDINGDGVDDLIIGAFSADSNGNNFAGESYVVFGRTQGFAASLNLADLDGRNGFILSGIGTGDVSGRSVSGAGDINGDGVDDLIIGAPEANPNGIDSGESYVVFGRTQGFAASLNLADLDGSNGFVLRGMEEFDRAGISVSGAGDINGDDIDDLIIGADLATPDGRSVAGKSYVVFGHTQGFAANLNLSTLDGSNGFVLNGIAPDDRAGFSVSGAGDVNGDGIDDLIIGAAGAAPNGNDFAGESYVVFGRDQGFDPSLELSDLDGRNGFVISGMAEYDLSSRSVSGAGDINGDGIDDLIIGAAGADPNGSSSGQSYVVFGNNQGFDLSLDPSTLDGRNGFVINGIDSGDRFGISVSGAEDINGDGIDDLIIGAFGADPNGANSGESYVVFGNNQGFAASLNLSDLNGSNGFILNGIDANDRSGRWVSGAGDINGDGINDLIIGAYGADPNGEGSGESYVVFGRIPLPQVSILATDAEAAEAGTDSGTFTITRTDDTTDALTVTYTVVMTSTATSGSDYDLLTGTVEIPAGVASTPVTLTPINDNRVEGTETVTVELTATADYELDNASSATITIADDDIAGFSLSQTTATVGEVNGSDSFILTLDAEPLSPVEFAISSDNPSEVDVSLSTVILDSSNWETGIEVTLNGQNDTDIDGDTTSTITVSVVATNSDDAFDGLDDQTISVTTTDDDVPPTPPDELDEQTVSVTTTDDDVPPTPPSVDSEPPTGINQPTFRGTGEPSTTVEVLNGATVLGTATVDGNGNWSVTPEAPLAAGEYSLTFRTLDADGNVSALSEPLVFMVDEAASTGGFTPFNDDFTGTEGRDVAFALAGNDIVRGLGGSDRLVGEAGNDQLEGGAGNDRLIGDVGNDILMGGADNDRILGGAGGDRLVGGAGNDRLVGGDGVDTLLGGSDADTLVGGVGNDRLSGQGGNDRMRGNLSADVLNGGAGNDRQFGGAGNDRLNGQGGNDVLRGGADRDVLRGGAGNDRLAGELGNDLIETGAGRDRIFIRPGQGFDRVTDFTDGQDRIVLDRINFGQLSIQQRNTDVLISRGTERLLLLQNTRVGDISDADFV